MLHSHARNTPVWCCCRCIELQPKFTNSRHAYERRLWNTSQRHWVATPNWLKCLLRTSHIYSQVKLLRSFLLTGRSLTNLLTSSPFFSNQPPRLNTKTLNDYIHNRIQYDNLCDWYLPCNLTFLKLHAFASFTTALFFIVSLSLANHQTLPLSNPANSVGLTWQTLRMNSRK